MIVSTSGSCMHSMTTETSSRSSRRTSKASSSGSPWSSSASSASDRPDHSGRLAANEMRRPPQPGSEATFSQPEIPRSISDRTRSRTCGSASADTQSSTPSAWSAGGRIVARVVAAAVYGYWSAPTSRPSARASSSRATASPARPHTERDPHLRCDTWRRRARTRRPDGRDRLVERLEQAVALVAHVGRVHAAAARRRGHERLDLVGSARASPGRRSGRVERPSAPASIAPSTAPTIAASSSGVAARASGPRTDPRTVPWPTRNATFGPSGCSATRSRYSPKVVQRGVSSFARSDRSTSSRPASVIGARVSPQLPESWVVKPWWRWLARAPSRKSDPSEWPCGSMKPGVTTRPVTSRTSPTPSGSTGDRSPTARIRSPRMPTSARTPGAAAAVDHGPAMEQHVEGGHARMVPRSTSAKLRIPWGYSSAGRAPAWHAGGPGFESP